MILKTSRQVVGLQNMLPLFDLGKNFDCVSVLGDYELKLFPINNNNNNNNTTICKAP